MQHSPFCWKAPVHNTQLQGSWHYNAKQGKTMSQEEPGPNFPFQDIAAHWQHSAFWCQFSLKTIFPTTFFMPHSLLKSESKSTKNSYCMATGPKAFFLINIRFLNCFHWTYNRGLEMPGHLWGGYPRCQCLMWSKEFSHYRRHFTGAKAWEMPIY